VVESISVREGKDEQQLARNETRLSANLMKLVSFFCLGN